MRLLSRNLLLAMGSLGFVAALVIACGSDGDSKFNDGEDVPPGFDQDGSFNPNTDLPDADLYANDPPPKWCGPDAAPVPPQPGGTEQCPDDKNKPGCGCLKAGEEAACWTGLRKHRGLGVCKDGVTKCIQKSENTLAWGECVGQVLPTPGATKGKEACGCFSAGHWKIANLSPCFFIQNNVVTAFSTTMDAQGTIGGCSGVTAAPTTPPATRWSTDTLTVDCAGHFKLCFRIRAGDFNNPQPTDCVVGEVCTEADYVKENVEQAWPDLPGWLGADNACAKKWEVDTPDNVSPGYGEMIVKGQSVRCDNIDDGNGGDLVFNRVQYCPRKCRDAANQNDPECVACQTAGQGQF